MSSLLECPLHTPEDHIGIAAAGISQHLADKRLLDPAGNADALAVDVAAKNRPGAMSAMAMPVTITTAGEILFDDVDTGEGGVRLVDASIEHCHDHAIARERRRIGLDRRYSPSVGGGSNTGGQVRVAGFDQGDRHRD